jgi:hypothetical protein
MTNEVYIQFGAAKLVSIGFSQEKTTMKMIFLILTTLFAMESFADTRSFDRTWLGLFNKRKFENTNYSFWTEAQLRLDNDEFNAQQVLIRPGVLKKINDENEIGFLIAFSEIEKNWETRPTFQHAYTIIKNEPNTLSYRSRIEYRVREDQEAVSGRYRGQLKWHKSLESGNAFILWDELFLNITREDWTGDRLVERNRFFIGMGIPFVDKTNFEVGYMNQHTPRSDRTTIDHVLILFFYY